MKTQFLHNRCAILAAAAGVALFSALGAQAAETFVNGTLQTFEPKTFVVKSETVPFPTTYTAAPKIEFVDEAGVAVAPELIKPGMRVSVYYYKQEDAMVAHRVVVREEVTATTTAPDRPLTKEAKDLREAQELSEREARRAAEKAAVVATKTSEGTLTSLRPDMIIVAGTSGENPITYHFTKTTEYVDETGAPVTLEVLKTGVPVTVTYVQEEDRLMARRVVVRSRAAARP